MESPDRLPVLATDPPLDDDELHALALSDPQDVEYRPWQITELRVADWAMRKVAEADALIDDAAEAATVWHAEIDAWVKRATARAVLSRAFLAHHLEQYALDRRDESGDREKTVWLPGGEVRTRSEHARVVVVDEAKLIEWCEANLMAEHVAKVVKVEKSIRLAELRHLIDLSLDIIADVESGSVVASWTGEIWPGVEVKPGRTTAKVVPR